MKKSLLFLILGLNSVSAQQNKIFKDTKKIYDQYQYSLSREFKLRYDALPKEQKPLLQKEYELVSAKIDSARNVAYIEALVKTKVQNDLGKNTTEAHAIDHKPRNHTSQAMYPTGLEGLRKEFAEVFYSEHIYTKGELRTEISFIVEENGDISRIKTHGDNHSFNQQAEIAMYLLSQRFIPAYIDGMPIRSAFRFPVKMKLE